MSYLPLVIVFAVIGTLLWNYRGRRTWWALALALSGGIFLTLAQRISGSPQHYFTGVALLFAGVFANGSFLYFWSKMRSAIRNPQSVIRN